VGKLGQCKRAQAQLELHKMASVAVRVAATATLVSCSALAVGGVGVGGATMQKTLLTEYDQARCLDGTAGAYYFAPGSGAGISKYLIFLQGGGW
jgi:hypothetical protein